MINPLELLAHRRRCWTAAFEDDPANMGTWSAGSAGVLHASRGPLSFYVLHHLKIFQSFSIRLQVLKLPETGVDMSLQTGVFLDLSFSNSKVSSLLEAENWNACKTHRTMSGRQLCFGKMGTLTSMITSLISPYLKWDFETKWDKGRIDWIWLEPSPCRKDVYLLERETILDIKNYSPTIHLGLASNYLPTTGEIPPQKKDWVASTASDHSINSGHWTWHQWHHAKYCWK